MNNHESKPVFSFGGIRILTVDDLTSVEACPAPNEHPIGYTECYNGQEREWAALTCGFWINTGVSC